jgi:hypothetical protein
MSAILSRDRLKGLVDHFGLKNVRHLTIDIPANGVVTVTAEIYPEIDGVMQLDSVMRKYALVEKWSSK